MTVTALRELLLWALVVNYSVLCLWFAVFWVGHDWLYRLHTRWFKLSRETFDAIHYSGMAIYKIGIFLVSLTPWVALHIAA
jgi:hypothetical protein